MATPVGELETQLEMAHHVNQPAMRVRWVTVLASGKTARILPMSFRSNCPWCLPVA